MADPSKTFANEEIANRSAPRPCDRTNESAPKSSQRLFVWFQLLAAYALIECALWAPQLEIRDRWAWTAALAVLLFVVLDRPSLQRLGLKPSTGFGASVVLAVSFAVAALLLFLVHSAGGQIPANPTWPDLHSAWQYVVWALMQQFLLQSFFFTRCEELFGTSAAVWVTATLFSAAHLPSPILTTFTLAGGLLFCEMFRRFRSIYPIGIVHAVMGLTIALTMPDSLLHHMRVGIGYLQY